MNTLTITKSDLKIVLALTTIIPVLCFIAGLYTSNIATKPSQIGSEQPNLFTNNKDQNISVLTPKIETTSEPNTNSKLLTSMVDDGKAKSRHITKQYIAQAGLFSSANNAKKLSDSLTQQKFNPQIIDENMNGKPLFRVIIGSFESKENATSYIKIIEQKYGIKLYLTSAELPFISKYIAAL